MTQKVNAQINIQFRNTYEGEKARRLVEELRRLASAFNSLVTEVNTLSGVEAPGIEDHVLATTAALGTHHTVAGLTAGQVLKALSETTAAFAKLQFSEMDQVDEASFLSPANGSALIFFDGFYTMLPPAFFAGAPLTGSYILATPNVLLPNSRVLDDSVTVRFDLSTSGVVSAQVQDGSIGATQLERPYSRELMLMGG